MSWKSVVGSVAPTIATALGGPLSGMAVSALCKAFGLEAGSSERDIERYVTEQPAAAIAQLKQAELEFKKLDVDFERIAAADRDSARNRQIQTKDKAPLLLGSLILAGFFAVVGYVLSGKLNLSGEQGVLIGTIVGYASAKADQVVSFFFGSSSGSSQKNAILAHMVKK